MARSRWMLVVYSTFALGCQAGGAPDKGLPEKASAAAPPAPVERLAMESVVPVNHHGIAWFEDATDAAKARALADNKPLFVDLWAPWCHTCLSMKNFVLTSEKLGELSSEFVYLALNTERAENAAVLEKLPIEAWPTFYVVEPRDLAPHGRWVGAASPAQFGDFMRDAKRAFQLARVGKAGGDDAFSLLLQADEQSRQGKHAEAAQGYAAALLRGGDTWTRRPDALVSQIAALSKAENTDGCVELAAAHMNDTGTGVSAADFAVYALGCADDLDPKDPRSRKVRELAAARLTPACQEERFTLMPDDRSDACAMLQEARETLGDKKAARRAAEVRLTILEKASADLPDDVALTYDWARAETLISLGRAKDALPFLEARERALPGSYNPPHYLARVYNALKEWDKGLVALERAITLVYGPRKASMLGLRADLLIGKGEREAARKAIIEQITVYRSLPAGQRQPRGEQRAEARLAQLNQAATP